ncbi:hypothetical protein SAMN04488034_102460 [Salinimicrobium catena]|uniref:Lipoprotein n=1 Tax=Salinimicrobium catena TaxID=390640 RepID=A0A1H5LX32_9FLAO|nr:hypothetical protein [Salinimicrobium catena]SDL15638.1 hypothetical protein SAMN04488140_102460 [Salinimicrobium catena]SEE81582.1 hypothetical protein SAMN04488034_102460 [Salinimicrobium catena]
MRSIILVLFVLLVGCGTTSNSFNSQEVMRDATDIPAYFENPAAVPGEKVCKSPLIDPRDGTKISFLRASWPMADYEVPKGKYGVGSSELLRVNCESGEVVGIVKR